MTSGRRTTLLLSLALGIATLAATLAACTKRTTTPYRADTSQTSVATNPDSSHALPVANAVYIGAHSVMQEWPLTVDSGYMTCDNEALCFTAIGGALDGKRYAMNGAAMNSHQFPKIDEIWKKGTNTPNVNITELFNRGETICGK